MQMSSQQKHFGHDHHEQPALDGTAKFTGTLKDPVCGMTVTAQSEHHVEHGGLPYYFCGVKCLTKFIVEPQKYAIGAPDNAQIAPKSVQVGAIYTCPMHPEIRQDLPGNCPKCGMTLEPELPSLEDDENPELVDFTRRFWWTLPLSVVVMVLAMAGHKLAFFHGDTQNWIELGLTLPVALWAGWPFYQRGVQSLVNRSPNMWTLIGLGTGVAFLYSVVATVAPQLFPATFVIDGRVAVYFEALR